MRVLLDENLPHRLKSHLPRTWQIATVRECGWSAKRNGELMRLAEQQFDVFVTMDRGIAFQQNIASFQIAVIQLRAASNRLPDLLPLVPELVAVAQTAVKGDVSQVPLV